MSLRCPQLSRITSRQTVPTHTTQTETKVEKESNPSQNTFRASGAHRAERQVCGKKLNLAAVAQLVERVLGKDEVTGPSPVSSSEFGFELYK